MVVLGVLVGLGLALLVARLMAGLLYGVSAVDPVTFVLVPLALLGVAAVDASLETIAGVVAEERGGGAGGQGGGNTPGDGREGGTLLLVHHGLFWDGNVPATGRRFRRLRALLENDIALYSAHIPLDVHPEVGNNAVLARGLGVVGAEPFTTYRGAPLGAAGVLELPREELVRRLEEQLGANVRLIPGGPAVARRVGIITGGAGTMIGAAHAAGLDTFITGEGPHHTYHDAMELGVNVIHAGHYATEQVGVRALAHQLSEQFGIPWSFHHHPTGL
jgi:dinuclear metal center YbgI/SA1388 family protein